MSRPYHKYVFDAEKRIFVGSFDEMYSDEERLHFDSWDQENMSHPARQIALIVINRYNFNSVLDYGCGKGHFANQLTKKNNAVTGIDISAVAIEKAKTRFPAIDFSVCDEKKFIAEYEQQHDLVIAMEVLSYISSWEELIKKFSRITSHLLITLYIPDNPIGFVKSIADLKKVFGEWFNIETEILIDREQILLMGKSRNNEASRT
jgi:2-polyprenyl-3-methyl-5-hydroxy-6-metoxy-1,4-benzoquinol methylase